MNGHLSNKHRFDFLTLLLFVTLMPVATLAQRPIPPSGLPTPKDWYMHLENDVMPFWSSPKTLRESGNFPTYRCNDGRLFTETKCPELTKPGELVRLDREYLR